jgi:hypothetical protein
MVLRKCYNLLRACFFFSSSKIKIQKVAAVLGNEIIWCTFEKNSIQENSISDMALKYFDQFFLDYTPSKNIYQAYYEYEVCYS